MGDRVYGRAFYGAGVTVLGSDLRIGQTGFGNGGFYTQYKDYSPGIVFNVTPPTSWHPVATISAPCVVGAYYTSDIQYSDGTTEFIELSNNVISTG